MSDWEIEAALRAGDNYDSQQRIAELERELEMNGAQMAGDSALIRGLKQENASLREALGDAT